MQLRGPRFFLLGRRGRLGFLFLCFQCVPIKFSNGSPSFRCVPPTCSQYHHHTFMPLCLANSCALFTYVARPKGRQLDLPVETFNFVSLKRFQNFFLMGHCNAPKIKLNLRGIPLLMIFSLDSPLLLPCLCSLPPSP